MGISVQNHIPDITIYPNPAYNKIYIVLQDKENCGIEIYNGIGETMFKGLIKTEKELDISSYQAGIYFIKVSNEYGNRIEKIIKLQN